MTPTFTSLREKHPLLRYRGYALARQGDEATATFLIDLEPGIEFRPTLTFSAKGKTDEQLEPYLAHLGLVETISYWKAACPPRVIIEGYKLTDDQTAWWRDLFIHGLGEFFFVNSIDPSAPDLLTIESWGERSLPPTHTSDSNTSGKELVLAAGGKDSSLALEMLKSFDASRERAVMILNPTRSARESVQIAGYADPIIVQRTIDPKLLALNSQGYLNGHTPFSAYLAFLSLLIAEINGCSSTIVSNERSASEENTIFHGLPVNHQYSKSIRFERRFKDYVARYLPGSASYYSIIRPLYDLQVSALFSRLAPKHLSSFRSCNVGQKADRWCGSCPKCAFVGITLAPFLSHERWVEIFGGDLFQSPPIIGALEELTGTRDHKPLECVGTLAESRDALVLTLARYEREGRAAPAGLGTIARTLASRSELPTAEAARETLRAWCDDHEIPRDYAGKLKTLLSEVG